MSGKGRLAYVTGGMGGIGTSITRRLCHEGYVVVAGCGPGSAGTAGVAGSGPGFFDSIRSPMSFFSMR